MKKKLIPLIFILFSGVFSAEIGDGGAGTDFPPAPPPLPPGKPKKKQTPINDGIGVLTGVAVSIIIHSQYNPKKNGGGNYKSINHIF